MGHDDHVRYDNDGMIVTKPFRDSNMPVRQLSRRPSMEHVLGAACHEQ